MDFLARTNEVTISPELLGEVLLMHAGLPPEDRRDHTVRMIRLFELLDDKGLQDDRADISIAIDFRLTALARLLAAQEALGWTIPGSETGMELIHPSLVRGAAEEPLIGDANHQPAFDPESFRQRVLTVTDPSGSA